LNGVPTAPTLLAVPLLAPILEQNGQVQEMGELRGWPHSVGSQKATPQTSS
jgi:hypothetical protein